MVSFKSIVNDKHVRRDYKTRIAEEFESDEFRSKLLAHLVRASDDAPVSGTVEQGHASLQTRNLRVRSVCYLASRTASSRSATDTAVAGWDEHLAFHVIDGGVMRDKSNLYAECGNSTRVFAHFLRGGHEANVVVVVFVLRGFSGPVRPLLQTSHYTMKTCSVN